MNERINRLEVQCWEPTQYGPAWFNSTKFAELIVEECANIFGQEGTGRYEVDGNWISKTIKQHFGVE